MTPNINKHVHGAKEFYPLNVPTIGTTLSPVGVLMGVYGLPRFNMAPGDLPAQ